LVVLIMVLLVTLAGLSAVRTLVVEERMASNSLDRNLAMQSAERVLREAEDIVLAQSEASPINAGFPVNDGGANGSYTGAACTLNAMTDASPCTGGLCSQPTPSCTPRWEDSAFDGWAEVSATVPAFAASATAGSDATLAAGTVQQYIVEYLGANFVCDPTAANDPRNCAQYRVTVRTKPGTDRAAVQLQTYLVSRPQ
jgi:type IV pilus assembly protein PilX